MKNHYIQGITISLKSSHSSKGKITVCCFVNLIFHTRFIFWVSIFQTLKLTEFIELNTLLGVSHFFFYNHTCSDQVSCILEDYRSRGRERENV